MPYRCNSISCKVAGSEAVNLKCLNHADSWGREKGQHTMDGGLNWASCSVERSLSFFMAIFLLAPSCRLTVSVPLSPLSLLGESLSKKVMSNE